MHLRWIVFGCQARQPQVYEHEWRASETLSGTKGYGDQILELGSSQGPHSSLKFTPAVRWGPGLRCYQKGLAGKSSITKKVCGFAFR